MHIALTDLITCPRCGPEWGLILLPHEVRDRRVASGTLGCPNCKGRYGVQGGVVDLRLAGGGDDAAPALDPGAAAAASAEAAVRLGGLLGLATVRGPVLLAGAAGSHAAGLAGLLQDVEVVQVAPAPLPGVAGEPMAGVSRVLVEGVLPFRGKSFAAVALTGAASALLEEGLRVVRPAGRVLVEPADGAVAERAAELGGRRLAHEGETLVLSRGP
jgi:uncharacterized protein YbaR (Trm112 family)